MYDTDEDDVEGGGGCKGGCWRCWRGALEVAVWLRGGVVWCGVVWYGLGWSGRDWRGVVRCGAVRCGTAWRVVRMTALRLVARWMYC